MMTKIIIISDTHNYHLQLADVPDGDILIHCGDATTEGSVTEIENFLSWFSWHRHKYKIFVPGNHDASLFEKDQLSLPFARKVQIPKEVIYLEGRYIEIEGLKIYGAPWRSKKNWVKDLPKRYNAFGIPYEKVEREWGKIPEGLDILITHIPPFGILDEFDGINFGCPSLLERVTKVKPKVHCFGHIHTGRGYLSQSDTTFINAAICDDCYDPNREPIVIDYEDGKCHINNVD